MKIEIPPTDEFMGGAAEYSVRDASELLVLLQSLQEQNVPLHKVGLRVEVGDSYYDFTASKVWYGRNPYRLSFTGPR